MGGVLVLRIFYCLLVMPSFMFWVGVILGFGGGGYDKRLLSVADKRGVVISKWILIVGQILRYSIYKSGLRSLAMLSPRR